MKRDHGRIEAIAGAIALGEASDQERREYREHISACARCLSELGGEHEIARVAQTVASARDCEVWQPAMGDVVRSQLSARTQVLRYTFSIVAACFIVALGVRVAVANGALHFLRPPTSVVAQSAGPTRVYLEQRRSRSVSDAVPEPQPRRLMVVHNVVQIARAPIAAPQSVAAAKMPSKPTQIAEITVHPDAAPPRTQSVSSDVPVWRRNVPSWRTVAKTTTTSLSESAPQSFTQSAESIRMMHPQAVREAVPIGGETAINPQPPMIAYDESAEGTTVFEVLVDEQGNPTKCIITRPSGYDVLDESVCKAAMRAKFSPKTVDGRPVAGVYHDAFTFRMTDDENVLAHPIHNK